MARLDTLRQRILRERGIVLIKPGRSRRKLGAAWASAIPDSRKTPAMKLAELRQGHAIEDLLLAGSTRQVSKRLGMDHTTVSKWIKRLGLRFSTDKLPDCTNCHRRNLTCQATGLCTILQEAHTSPDALLAKRDQVLAPAVVRVQPVVRVGGDNGARHEV